MHRGEIIHESRSQRGVQQGSVLSPFLFSIALETVLDKMKLRGFPSIAYLDDTEFYLENDGDFKDLLQTLT